MASKRSKKYKHPKPPTDYQPSLDPERQLCAHTILTAQWRETVGILVQRLKATPMTPTTTSVCHRQNTHLLAGCTSISDIIAIFDNYLFHTDEIDKGRLAEWFGEVSHRIIWTQWRKNREELVKLKNALHHFKPPSSTVSGAPIGKTLPMDSVLELSIQCWLDMLPSSANDDFEGTMRQLCQTFNPYSAAYSDYLQPEKRSHETWLAIPRVIFIAKPSSPYHIGGTKMRFTLAGRAVFSKDAIKSYSTNRKQIIRDEYSRHGYDPLTRVGIYTGQKGRAFLALRMEPMRACFKCRKMYGFVDCSLCICSKPDMKDKDDEIVFEFPSCAEDTWEVKEVVMKERPEEPESGEELAKEGLYSVVSRILRWLQGLF